MSELKARLTEDMKISMKAKDKPRLATIRLALAEIKQREVDERKDLSDADVLAVIDKMVKQRRDSASQFDEAGRDDLAAQEKAEIEVLIEYLPTPLTDDEINALIDQAMAKVGATDMKGMGQIMAELRPAVQGRADMQAVSGKVRARLTS